MQDDTKHIKDTLGLTDEQFEAAHEEFKKITSEAMRTGEMEAATYQITPN